MAKVALEAIRGELTIAQLVAKHGVHLTLMREIDAQFLGRRGMEVDR